MLWKEYRKKRPWRDLMFCPGICLELLKKATKILSQDSQPAGRDFNL
jgi:hypothetical protein